MSRPPRIEPPVARGVSPGPRRTLRIDATVVTRPRGPRRGRDRDPVLRRVGRRLSHARPTGPATAGRGRQEPVPAELRDGGVHGVRAAQVVSEPHVEHLAALGDARAFRAASAGRRSEPALRSLDADDVRVPAADRTGGRGAGPPARHAEHHADEHERMPRLVRVDQRFGPPWVEEATVVAVAPAFGVEVADGGARGRSASRGACRSRRAWQRARRATSPTPPGWPGGSVPPMLSVPESRARARGTGAGGSQGRAPQLRAGPSDPEQACRRSCSAPPGQPWAPGSERAHR